MKLRTFAIAVLFAALAAVAQQNPAAMREALQKEADDTRRAQTVRALIKVDAAGSTDFLLELLKNDPSPRVRMEIVQRLPLNDERVLRGLEQAAASDKDAAVSIAALARVRRLHALLGLQLAAKRLQAARQSGNAAELAALAAEHDRWIAAAAGGTLPGFMMTPPPVFAVKPAGAKIRVLAFGDFGQGTERQQRTAAAMLKFHRTSPFDFGITMGDNFYSIGMESPEDPRWKTWWNELYDPIGVPIFASLGNHDWGQPDSPAAEVIYTQKSRTWRMPATRYTFTAGPAQFFALDTQTYSEAQSLWLRDELKKSTATWKIVYGHHPIYSHGQHGDTRKLITDLLPVLRGTADAYFAGHEHDMQHLKPEGGVHLFISGGGGAPPRVIQPGPRSLFAHSGNGFTVLEASAGELAVKFYDTDVKLLYEYTLKKAATAGQ